MAGPDKLTDILPRRAQLSLSLLSDVTTIFLNNCRASPTTPHSINASFGESSTLLVRPQYHELFIGRHQFHAGKKALEAHVVTQVAIADHP